MDRSSPALSASPQAIVFISLKNIKTQKCKARSYQAYYKRGFAVISNLSVFVFNVSFSDAISCYDNIPYILESNPQPFYSFRGLKNQMRIRIACGLDSPSWAGFWKNDRAAVRVVRKIQYNNLLFYLLFILYNIYNLLFIRLAVITHNWISLPCKQGAVEGKVRIRTAK